MRVGRRSRRQFMQGSPALAGLGLLAGCGVLRPWADAPARIHRLGFLVVTAELAPQNEAFLDGLRELGYVDGQTIHIDYRFAGGAIARYPELLAELVQLGPDVIMVPGDAAARVARDTTTTIPVVFVSAGDPVGQGFVSSLARPGGNLTGLLVEPVGSDLVGKRLELLRAIVPDPSGIAVIWDESVAGPRTMTQAERAGQALGLRVRSLKVETPAEIDGAFEIASNEGVQAALVPLSPFMLEHRTRIAEQAAKRHLPVMYPARQFVEVGGLAAYAANQSDVHRRAATYVDKILKGASPAELPVELPATFELLINLKTAQALGLIVPQSVLSQATELIQ